MVGSTRPRFTRPCAVLRTALRDPLSVTVLGCAALVWCIFVILMAVFWWSDTGPVAPDGTSRRPADLVLVLILPTIIAVSWVTTRAVWIRRVLRQGRRVQAVIDVVESEGVVLFAFDYRWGGRSFRRQGWAFPLPSAAFLQRNVRTEIAFLEDQPERPVITRLFEGVSTG